MIEVFKFEDETEEQCRLKCLDELDVYNNEILTNEEVRECFNKVLASMSTIRQDKKEHIRNIKGTLEEKQKTCPRCKSELVERKGAYGKFLGCNSYPRCKYTYSK